MTEVPTRRKRRPSLRLRLLATLMVPILGLLLTGTIVTYGIVVNYDKTEHDRALVSDARSVAALLRTEQQIGSLSPQVRYLLSFDTEGRSYFAVESSLHGLLSSTDHYPIVSAPPDVDAEPLLFDSIVDGEPVRAVCLRFRSPKEPADLITVTMAETLHSRERLARDILLVTLLLQGLLITGLLTAVWLGVNMGLRSLQPLMKKLSAREHELSPITDADVPREIIPLTRTIDALFRRLREAIKVQEHFIADAAHQLRTPLAGLLLHVDRALEARDPEAMRDALTQVAQLTARAGRTSTQLLALMRAQSPLDNQEELASIDLAALARDAVGRRVHDGLRAGIDLGYQGPATPLFVAGNAAGLRDLLDNLIDNAVTYAGRRSTVTVSVTAEGDGSATLGVEDDGPGVPEAYLSRLGERFFRLPGSPDGGTGLGLAIVQRIADRHHAWVEYSRGTQGGLCVSIHFPATPQHA